MTKKDYDKATAILEQLNKIEEYQKTIQKVYDKYKNSGDSLLLEILSKSDNAFSVLKEIDENKFKAL